jgi:hypothetical protein
MLPLLGEEETAMASVQSALGRASLVDRRLEERHEGLVESALLHFRGRPYRVPVINISTRGAMIETDLVPRMGEPVLIEFNACSRIHAFVRWVRDGRVGLNFGHELVLVP